MLIELWQLEDACLILPAPSGVVYSNQAGGTACNHPELEGACVPLGLHIPVRNPLRDETGTPYDPALVASFLKAIGREWAFEPLTVEEAKAFGGEVMEAWVPVRVKDTDDAPWCDMNIKALAGKAVVLAYPNSD